MHQFVEPAPDVFPLHQPPPGSVGAGVQQRITFRGSGAPTLLHAAHRTWARTTNIASPGDLVFVLCCHSWLGHLSGLLEGPPFTSHLDLSPVLQKTPLMTSRPSAIAAFWVEMRRTPKCSAHQVSKVPYHFMATPCVIHALIDGSWTVRLM
ncbi:unnamed protein product [Prorocentrum cordatum]|uniref:Uncharacterized protein n=1 Tax=Prorocentrum cordatum TaxID=2364126 RepID=A0ABN9TY03_9DINO|nr:unnamed protein product [Polarella glacialis]